MWMGARPLPRPVGGWPAPARLCRGLLGPRRRRCPSFTTDLVLRTPARAGWGLLRSPLPQELPQSGEAPAEPSPEADPAAEGTERASPVGPPRAGEGVPGGAAAGDHPQAPGSGGRAAELPEVLPPAASPLLVGGSHAAIPDWQCGGSSWEESGGLKVQVVTAGTLMDPSDLSEDIQAPTGEGFRLEDVDWNSIAHRYPNLFTNMELDSQQKQPWPWPQLDAGSPRSPGKHSEGHHKTVNWGSLPCLGTSSSGGADSDSSSCQPGLTDHLLKASGHSPQGWGASSHQALVQARSSGRGSEDFQKTRSTRHPKPVPAPELCTDPDYPGPEHQQSPTRSCLKIVAVSVRKKLVRILNQSQQETADLGGAVLKQLVRGRPERLYRFPPATLLAPLHHVTVWGEGPRNAKKPPRASSGREPDPSHSGRDCVTLLLDPKGEVLSEHRIPHCATPAPTVFVDGTDLSIDSFPLPEAGPGADPCGPPGTLRRGSVLREPRVGRRRPRTRALQPSSASSGKRFHPREPPAQHLPPIPGERAPEGERGPPDPTPPPADKERRVRVCRKSVERSCPMVALSVPSTAESRYGFRFLSFLPFTADACRRA
nr:lamin tail domain-containing protein 2 isoform X5 [Saimiri boliviensis boliviensis]